MREGRRKNSSLRALGPLPAIQVKAKISQRAHARRSGAERGHAETEVGKSWIIAQRGDSQIRTQIERWLLARQKELGAGLPEQIKCDPGDSAP